MIIAKQRFLRDKGFTITAKSASLIAAMHVLIGLSRNLQNHHIFLMHYSAKDFLKALTLLSAKNANYQKDVVEDSHILTRKHYIYAFFVMVGISFILTK